MMDFILTLLRRTQGLPAPPVIFNATFIIVDATFTKRYDGSPRKSSFSLYRRSVRVLFHSLVRGKWALPRLIATNWYAVVQDQGFHAGLLDKGFSEVPFRFGQNRYLTSYRKFE